MKRKGIAAAGNWIVDRIKVVDVLPERGMLANVLSESRSPGGAAANVLADLALLDPGLSLTGIGMVGADEEGRCLRAHYERMGVDMDLVQTNARTPTSYTDVMSEARGGARTFFHYRGANAVFGPEHIPVEALTCRLFHLGYLLLLDRMDAADDAFGTVAARLLHDVQRQGIKTSVDVVSEAGDRFRRIVPPALRYVDYLLLNEVEAGKTAGIEVRGSGGKLDGPALEEAVALLSGMGAMELIAVHMPEGVYVRLRDGKVFSVGSLHLPDRYCIGTTGAGDAFCAGVLYGLHEGWDPERSVFLGTCCAAACLSAEDASSGVKALKEVLALGNRFPRRAAPVRLL